MNVFKIPLNIISNSRITPNECNLVFTFRNLRLHPCAVIPTIQRIKENTKLRSAKQLPENKIEGSKIPVIPTLRCVLRSPNFILSSKRRYPKNEFGSRENTAPSKKKLKISNGVKLML